jgi:hypothetical protein
MTQPPLTYGARVATGWMALNPRFGPSPPSRQPFFGTMDYEGRFEDRES